ncbi:TadE/TadG family type IV pilus assembly protein [Chelativorans salis]|uniref:Pilus assembly protein n=1 Tax=Chelativorans salis TaxID=2978478 RepID=A0ABT2LLF6_9HYPH|nr:TadE/TadG family type IV pilus assembly protein [Chelativorans sp. EGI FJ00035]MCT7374652.1 pilus assembly protein [Chelativorans sp. EGI FJ00035]
MPRLMQIFAQFRREERGAVLAEAIIVIPFVTIFTAGILEFGNMFWQKEQIETGLRDAARYLARCQTNPSFAANCNQTVALNIAYYGTALPGDGTPLRVPGWGPDASEITISEPVAGVIRLATGHDYESSPLFGWLGISAITIEAYHDQRYIGW